MRTLSGSMPISGRRKRRVDGATGSVGMDRISSATAAGVTRRSSCDARAWRDGSGARASGAASGRGAVVARSPASTDSAGPSPAVRGDGGVAAGRCRPALGDDRAGVAPVAGWFSRSGALGALDAVGGALRGKLGSALGLPAGGGALAAERFSGGRAGSRRAPRRGGFVASKRSRCQSCAVRSTSEN